MRLPARLADVLHDLAVHDRPTHRHAAAVARYARAIVKELGCGEDELRTIGRAALLHDIGKLRFPAPLLDGGRRPDEADWTLIHAHPVIGARLAAEAGADGAVTDAIALHHERPDGEGYPFALRGGEVPLGARVIAVADAFDVMTARDLYSPPKPPLAAIAELRALAGRQFDPGVVEAFVRTLAGQRRPEPVAA